MKRVFRIAFWLISPVLIYLTCAVIGAFVPGQRGDAGATVGGVQIILAQGPIHYDILLPVDGQTRAIFGFVEKAGVPLDRAQWLALGWGSAAFYTTAGRYRDVSLGAVWTAATGDAGVIRAEVYGALPDHPSLKRVRLSMAQLDLLRRNIRDDMGRDPLPLAGFSGTDAFFPARGRFHLLRTCNVWVGDQLTQAGLRFGVWTPTPYAVTLALWWNGHLSR